MYDKQALKEYTSDELCDLALELPARTFGAREFDGVMLATSATVSDGYPALQTAAKN